MRLLLAVAALLAAGAAAAQDLPALYRVTGVAADDRLNIRAEPSASADLRGSLAPGVAGVEVVEVTADGRWGRVNAGEATGWVSMRYMAAEGGAPWHALQAPLQCYGTEPFWSLTVPAGDGPLLLERMGEEALGLGRTVTSPAFDWPSTVGIGLTGPAREGFAVIRAEGCSDGMSDRVMGLSLRMFLSAHDGAEGYVGCCTLER